MRKIAISTTTRCQSRRRRRRRAHRRPRCCRRSRRPRHHRRRADTAASRTACAPTRAACAPWRIRALSGLTSTCALTIRCAHSAVFVGRSWSEAARTLVSAARRICTGICEYITAADWSAGDITVRIGTRASFTCSFEIFDFRPISDMNFCSSSALLDTFKCSTFSLLSVYTLEFSSFIWSHTFSLSLVFNFAQKFSEECTSANVCCNYLLLYQISQRVEFNFWV